MLPLLSLTLQVELRDVDSGNKVNERLRTDEAVESMYTDFLSICIYGALKYSILVMHVAPLICFG